MPPASTSPFPLEKTLKDLALLRTIQLPPLSKSSAANTGIPSSLDTSFELSRNFQLQSRTALHLHQLDMGSKAAATLHHLQSVLEDTVKGLADA